MPVTKHSAVEWAARLPPSNFSPMLLGDHVLPARQPNSCSPHFDNDEKQMPSSVPTYCCWHCHSPLGFADTLFPPPPRAGWDLWGSAPHGIPSPTSLSVLLGRGTSEPPGCAWDEQQYDRCF